MDKRFPTMITGVGWKSTGNALALMTHLNQKRQTKQINISLSTEEQRKRLCEFFLKRKRTSIADGDNALLEELRAIDPGLKPGMRLESVALTWVGSRACASKMWRSRGWVCKVISAVVFN